MSGSANHLRCDRKTCMADERRSSPTCGFRLTRLVLPAKHDMREPTLGSHVHRSSLSRDRANSRSICDILPSFLARSVEVPRVSSGLDLRPMGFVGAFPAPLPRGSGGFPDSFGFSNPDLYRCAFPRLSGAAPDLGTPDLDDAARAMVIAGLPGEIPPRSDPADSIAFAMSTRIAAQQLAPSAPPAVPPMHHNSSRNPGPPATRAALLSPTPSPPPDSPPQGCWTLRSWSLSTSPWTPLPAPTCPSSPSSPRAIASPPSPTSAAVPPASSLSTGSRVLRPGGRTA